MQTFIPFLIASAKKKRKKKNRNQKQKHINSVYSYNHIYCDCPVISPLHIHQRERKMKKYVYFSSFFAYSYENLNSQFFLSLHSIRSIWIWSGNEWREYAVLLNFFFTHTHTHTGIWINIFSILFLFHIFRIVCLWGREELKNHLIWNAYNEMAKEKKNREHFQNSKWLSEYV